MVKMTIGGFPLQAHQPTSVFAMASLQRDTHSLGYLSGNDSNDG